jgi:hypothetical protein
MGEARKRPLVGVPLCLASIIICYPIHDWTVIVAVRIGGMHETPERARMSAAWNGVVCS